MDGVNEIIVVLVTLLACVYTTFADVNCYHDAGKQKLQRQCFQDNGIDVTFPSYEVNDTPDDMRNSYVEAVIAQRPDQLCAQQAEFKKALECAMRHTILCMPTEYQGYLPQPGMMQRIVDKLCDKKTKIDFNCVKNKSLDLFDCGFRKGQEAFSDGSQDFTLENILCKAFQFNAACQRTELTSCGCSTVQAYESISRDILYPPSCPKPVLREPPIQCNKTHPDLFIQVNNQGIRRISDVSFFFLAVFGVSFVLWRQFLVTAL